MLDATAAEPLAAAAEGDPYDLRLRALRLALPWMRRLQEGMRLMVDSEGWVNKTSGRGSITLGVAREDGADTEELVSWSVFLGLKSYSEVVPQLFPWAEVGLHEETYDDADYDEWQSESVFYDDGDRIETRSYGEWRAARPWPELRPYANSMGEVDRWRLELTLGELGRAFLIVDGFASAERTILTP